MSATLERTTEPADLAGVKTLNFREANLPAQTHAVLSALQFEASCLDGLRALPPKECASLVEWCDRRQITLVLESICQEAFPIEIQRVMAQRREGFEQRTERIHRQLSAIADALEAANLPFVLLKGFTHSPSLSPDPILRVQGDIDLWCQPDRAKEAFELLQRIGYSTGPVKSDRHLPPLALPHTWVWDGNLAEIPISVEIHHALWSWESEHIPVPGLEDMWARRESRVFSGRPYYVLAAPDLVAFAALHFFLHLLHGDLPLQRLWEIANFLHSDAANVSFWETHASVHSIELRQIQTIVFLIAGAWFGCALPERVLDDAGQLPEHVRLWLERFMFAPLHAQTDWNKNYLWLRLAMMPRLSARTKVFFKSLVPLTLPVFVDRSGAKKVSVIGSLVRQRKYALSRIKRHVAAIVPTINGGVRWIATILGLEQGFGAFLAANVLFDIGEFLFVILYNFYMLEIGLREDSIGLVAAAMTAGTLLGSPLAAAVQARVELRGLLVIAALGGGIATMLRAFSVDLPVLMATAVLNGLFFSFWAVAFPPVTAGLTRARYRSLIFGFVSAIGMTIGILVGLVGVRMPAWIGATLSVSQRAGNRSAILAGSVLVLLSAIPAFRVRVPGSLQSGGRQSYPRGRFITLFLGALFLWMFATTSFNAFGIPYLSLQMHMQPARIGELFSVGQLLQVIAMLCGPLLIQRMGEKRYVFGTAMATAGALLLLATGARPLCIAMYLAYVTFQYMNEPSLFALLMNRVTAGARSGASSLMFITMSVASTIAAPLAGRAIGHLGYPVCLAIAAMVAACAALLFFRLPDFASDLHKTNNN